MIVAVAVKPWHRDLSLAGFLLQIVPAWLHRPGSQTAASAGDVSQALRHKPDSELVVQVARTRKTVAAGIQLAP